MKALFIRSVSTPEWLKPLLRWNIWGTLSNTNLCLVPEMKEFHVSKVVKVLLELTHEVSNLFTVVSPREHMITS